MAVIFRPFNKGSLRSYPPLAPPLAGRGIGPAPALCDWAFIEAVPGAGDRDRVAGVVDVDEHRLAVGRMADAGEFGRAAVGVAGKGEAAALGVDDLQMIDVNVLPLDRKSTRLNSSH